MFLIRIDNSPRRLVRAEDDRMKHVLKRKSGKFLKLKIFSAFTLSDIKILDSAFAPPAKSRKASDNSEQIEYTQEIITPGVM